MGKKKREQEQETREAAINIEADFGARLKQIDKDAEKARAAARSTAAAAAKVIDAWYQKELGILKEQQAQDVQSENARYIQEVAALKKLMSDARRAHESRLAKIGQLSEPARDALRKQKTGRLNPVESELSKALTMVDENRSGEIAIAEQERFERLSALETEDEQGETTP